MGQRRSVRWGTAEKIRSSLPQGAHGQEHGPVLPTGSSSPVDDRPPTGVLHSNDPTLDRRRTGDRANEKPLISNSSENYTSSFRSRNGVCHRRRAWRSVGIHCARKALHPQIGTAQYLVRLSPPCAGKLRTSRRHDERYIRVKIGDRTETRPIVRRQRASRWELKLGTTRIIRSAIVSARRFCGLRSA